MTTGTISEDLIGYADDAAAVFEVCLDTNAPDSIKSFNNYKCLKTIGEGTFGKVKLAMHIPTGEKVAIKKVFQDRRYKNRELCNNEILEIQKKGYFRSHNENAALYSIERYNAA